ncbi:MAG: ribonuclease HII [Candidatus Brennerbacteria bacterium]|nr:ribonuclease HII [Candidatus Brennerbacteria bacterium]
MEKKHLVIGVDEVGRGALCGSVTVAAFAFLDRKRFFKEAPRAPLRDSKRLTLRARECWFETVREHARAGNVVFATARVLPRTVDRVNITNAANLAATRAYERLVATAELTPSSLAVLLDGGLFISPHDGLTPRVTLTIVRGDEKVSEIQLASIVAKVTRDRAMARLHARYPAYGFAAHKGYGTDLHRRALARHGPSAVHRLTFLKNFLKVRTI